VEETVGAQSCIALHRGVTWTTDAPYRETEAAILRVRDQGALAVEMEAAVLYAFGTTRGQSVVCFAHVTNAMGQRREISRRATPTAQRRRWLLSPLRLAPGGVSAQGEI
jgi:purine-nucleoside phosphorylase